MEEVLVGLRERMPSAPCFELRHVELLLLEAQKILRNGCTPTPLP